MLRNYQYGPPPNNEFQYWIGLFSSSPDGVESPPAGLQMAAFRFRPAVIDQWRVYGSDASGFLSPPPASPISVQPDTEYLLGIEFEGTKAVFRIDSLPYQTLDTSLNHRLPDPSKLLGYGVRVFVFGTTGEDRTIRWKRISWDHV